MVSWQTLFILWVGCLTFITWNGMFEGAKIIWFLTGGIGLLLLWVLYLRNKLSYILTHDDVWYFGWLGTLIVSSLLGIHPMDSFLGGSYRHQGVLFFFILWLVGKTVQVLSNEKQQLLCKFLGIGALFQAVLVIIEEMMRFIFPYFTGIHPLGTLGEPHALAGYLVVSFWFLFPLLKKKSIILPIVSLALIATAVLFTQSKTGIIAMLFSIIAYGLTKKRRNVGTKIIVGTLIFLSIIPNITRQYDGSITIIYHV